MGYRLVPKSVTLNDLERRNSPNGCVISLNSVAFGAYYAKVFEDTPTLSAAEMYPKEFPFGDIFFIAIFTGPNSSDVICCGI